MKFTYILAAAAVVLTVAAAPKAEAAYYDGVATTNLNVRAGPGKYPIIGKISRGTPLNVRGCVQGYKWCDVSTRGFRGWVAGQHIGANYRSRHDTVSVLGNLLGLNVVTYDERTYWGNNYYDRDFYRTKYGWNDNDGRRYGWKKSNGRWVRYADEDHDGVPNKYDRYDNDGGGKYDKDNNWRQVNGKWVRVGDEDHDGIPNNHDRWDNDGRGSYDSDRNNNYRGQYNN